MAKAITHSVLSRMLQIALIDIRAAETLEKAQALADIFHNVPSSIANNLAAEETWSRLRDCAGRHGMEGYIDQLFAWAAKRESG